MAGPDDTSSTGRRRLQVIPPVQVTRAWERHAGGDPPPGELILDAEVRPPEPVDRSAVEKAAVHVLRRVRDPEIPVNVVDLGLVYRLEVSDHGSIEVDVTLTAPGCPVAGKMLEEIHQKLQGVTGASRVRTRLVWEPPWTPARMSEGARLTLGML